MRRWLVSRGPEASSALCSGSLGCPRNCRGLAIALAEFLDATSRVHALLLACVERVAVRADFHVQLPAQDRFGLELVPAAADDCNFLVLRMNLGLHGRSFHFTSWR